MSIKNDDPERKNVKEVLVPFRLSLLNCYSGKQYKSAVSIRSCL